MPARTGHLRSNHLGRPQSSPIKRFSPRFIVCPVFGLSGVFLSCQTYTSWQNLSHKTIDYTPPIMSSILYYSARYIHARLISISLKTAAISLPSALTEAISIVHHDEVMSKENNTCLSPLISPRLLNLRLIFFYITVDHSDTIVTYYYNCLLFIRFSLYMGRLFFQNLFY